MIVRMGARLSIETLETAGIVVISLDQLNVGEHFAFKQKQS